MKTTKQFLAGMGFATTIFACTAFVLKLYHPEKAKQVIEVLTTTEIQIPEQVDSLIADTVDAPKKSKMTPGTITIETGISQGEFCSVLGCFTKDDNLFAAENGYSKLQDQIAKILGMPIISEGTKKKPGNLDSCKQAGYLVKLTETSYITFKAKELKPENEWGTREMKDFLDTLSIAFYKKYGKKLQLTSAVRTIEYQKKLSKKNRNARKEGSVHCTGSTFDISYQDSKDKSPELNMTQAEQNGIEALLKELIERHPNVWVLKEHNSCCYHIVVFADYRNKKILSFNNLPRVTPGDFYICAWVSV